MRVLLASLALGCCLACANSASELPEQPQGQNHGAGENPSGSISGLPESSGAAGSDAGSPPTVADGGAPTSDAGTPVSTVCPPGLGKFWICSGAARVRCVDQTLETDPCANGCVPPAGAFDAYCACGAQSNLTHWNCLADGDLHACKAGGILHKSCEARGCDAQPLGQSDLCKPTTGKLQTMMNTLGAQCAQYSPGSFCGISVKDLDTGETASWKGTQGFEAASSPKAIWVALALRDVGADPTKLAKLKALVTPVFANSDNSASGRVIDLLSSPDRINGFMWHDLHMPDSGFCRWNYDGNFRGSSLCDATVQEGYNYLAADDAVDFLSAVWGKKLLGAADTQQLLSWMTLSPRSGYGGWFGTQLPAAARATMYHKAGWIPPNASNEIGIVAIPNGHAYAASILVARTDGSQTAYDRQLKFLEYASCVIYHSVAADTANAFTACTHP